jgi:hypothetical protein
MEVPEKIEPNDNEKLNLLTADRRKLIDEVKNQKQAPLHGMLSNI